MHFDKHTDGFTSYCTAEAVKRVCSAKLYHSRQCCIVIKPRLACLHRRLLYDARLQPKTVKTIAVQAYYTPLITSCLLHRVP